MHEDYLLKCRAWATAGWCAVGLLMGAAWIVGVFDTPAWHIAALLALSGCAASAVAATLQIRSFLVNVSTLIRHAAAKRGTEQMGIRPLD